MPKKPEPWWRKDRQAWFVQINRKRYNLGRNKKEAWHRFHELMAHPEKRAIVVSDSLVTIIDTFLEWVSKHRSPHTYEWYRYRLQRFCEKYPSLKVRELRPFHVETWVDEYNFSITSRRNYLRTIKRCLKWAKQQGYIDANPIENMEVPSAEAKEVVISQAEFDRLLTFVRNSSLADLLIVTWNTGCRPQESLRVESRHVDLANHRWIFQKSEAKMKRATRVIYLNGEAMAITRRWMLAHPEGPLFCNSAGRPWTTDAVNCAIDAIRVRMGKETMKKMGETISDEEIATFIPTLSLTKRVKGEVVEKRATELRCEAKQKLTRKRATELAPRYSLYALRHSWATNALLKGVDPLTVAILMGHKDPSTLTKVYQHLSLNPQHMLE